MTITDLLTTYWSQFTLFLLGVGYLIKRIFDIRAKKAEINHTIFQEKRLESVSNFFRTYAKTSQMWSSLKIFNIVEDELEPEEIDKIIFPPQQELQRCILELQIYFEEKEHKYFMEILENIYEINRLLMGAYIYFGKEKTKVERASEFQKHMRIKLKDNEIIFKTISTFLRQTFK